MTTIEARQHHGALAFAYCKKKLPLQVLGSNAGYYIGTADDEGPCSRESCEYWPTTTQAEHALNTGAWTQKDNP